MMFNSCLGNNIGVSKIRRCAKLDYTSVHVVGFLSAHFQAMLFKDIEI